jgi:hypothetical protein
VGCTFPWLGSKKDIFGLFQTQSVGGAMLITDIHMYQTNICVFNSMARRILPHQSARFLKYNGISLMTQSEEHLTTDFGKKE